VALEDVVGSTGTEAAEDAGGDFDPFRGDREDRVDGRPVSPMKDDEADEIQRSMAALDIKLPGGARGAMVQRMVAAAVTRGEHLIARPQAGATARERIARAGDPAEGALVPGSATECGSESISLDLPRLSARAAGTEPPLAPPGGRIPKEAGMESPDYVPEPELVLDAPEFAGALHGGDDELGAGSAEATQEDVAAAASGGVVGGRGSEGEGGGGSGSEGEGVEAAPVDPEAGWERLEADDEERNVSGVQIEAEPIAMDDCPRDMQGEHAVVEASLAAPAVAEPAENDRSGALCDRVAPEIGQTESL